MSRGAPRGRSAHAAWVLPALVFITIAATGLLYLRGDLNPILCDGPCEPRYVTAPVGLESMAPAIDRPAKVGTGPINGADLKDAVADGMASASLGGRSGMIALDARDGDVLVPADDTAYLPASTTKLLTAFTALEQLGPQARFTTKVVRDGDQIVLVGGGDPYLTVEKPKVSAVEKADLRGLAKQVAAAVKGTQVTVGYDVSRFSGPAVSPGWEATYVSDGVVAPISPLWIDRGRVGLGRSTDPAGDAARAFVGELVAAGVDVAGEPDEVEAAGDASTIASARSGTVGRIVEKLLTDSDNEVAEVMLRQAAIAAGRPGSFEGGDSTVTSTLADAGISTKGLKLTDGSGLSRDNRITPLTLASTLATSIRSARTGAVVSGLPIGGLTGTLAARYALLGDARGLVRAKTGTLTGVHSLAGIATLSDGRPVAFAVMADDTASIDPFVSQAALDRVAADIAGCECQ